MKNLLTNILLILTTWSFAQVGINTENPSQMLDVEGRIEISDDNSPPTDGAIRYNATEEEFEGYAGTQWNSFTARGIGYPSNPIPVYGYRASLLPDSQNDVTFWSHETTNFNLGTQVPTGKYLLITHILVEINDPTNYDDICLVSVGPRASGFASSDWARRLKLWVRWSNHKLFSSDMYPLLIIRPGEFLTVRNHYSSPNMVTFKIKGFLVDDLDFSN